MGHLGGVLGRLGGWTRRLGGQTGRLGGRTERLGGLLGCLEFSLEGSRVVVSLKRLETSKILFFH